MAFFENFNFISHWLLNFIKITWRYFECFCLFVFWFHHQWKLFTFTWFFKNVWSFQISVKSLVNCNLFKLKKYFLFTLNKKNNKKLFVFLWKQIFILICCYFQAKNSLCHFDSHQEAHVSLPHTKSLRVSDSSQEAHVSFKIFICYSFVHFVLMAIAEGKR